MALNAAWLQNLSYSAQIDRQLIEALVIQEGVTNPLSLKVEVTSPASYGVRVRAGGGFIKGDDSADQGMYYVYNTAQVTTGNVTVPSAGLCKKVAVCLAVQDPDASGPSGNNAVIKLVDGSTASVGSTPPDPTVPASHLLLAHVYVQNGQANVGTGNITDKRSLCGGIEHIGSIKPWAATSLLPGGWLVCDGSDVSRTTYAELFEAIGTTFGPGDGSNTFTLPDLRGRVPVGAGTGNYSSPVTPRTVGDKGGVEAVALGPTQIPSHSHTINHDHGNAVTDVQGDHGHAYSGLVYVGASGGNAQGGGNFSVGLYATSTAGAHSHNLDLPNFSGSSGSAGGGASHENMPPFLGVRYIVRAA